MLHGDKIMTSDLTNAFNACKCPQKLSPTHPIALTDILTLSVDTVHALF